MKTACHVLLVTTGLIGLTALRAGRACAQTTDPWLGADKGLHLTASAALAAGGYAGSVGVLEQPWQRAIFGAGLSLGAGVGKELYDALGHGDASARDLTWDAIGCAFGIGVAVLVDYAFRSPASARQRALGPLVIVW